MRCTGEQYELAAGGYAATVTEVGAALRALTHDGRELVKGFAADAVMPLYRGAVLAPWPNRIGDGRYAFAGATHQLPLNEPERGCALHGLVAHAPWRLLDRGPSWVALAHRLWPRPGYPFLLDLEVRYALGDGGLTWTLVAHNAGDVAAPYGCSVHPYLVAGPGRVDDWTFELPASRYLDVDPERLLPRGLADVTGGPLDFRAPRRIGGTAVDHAFTDLGAGRAARLLAADGDGVELRWDAASRWVQVHTADRPEPENDRVGLAVEPMTCPPDAFRSGVDLVRLHPGERHEASWSILRAAVSL